VNTKANLTMWLVAIRREHAKETDPAKRDLLCNLYGECARRLLKLEE
jgi:hypothetical protein